MEKITIDGGYKLEMVGGWVTQLEMVGEEGAYLCVRCSSAIFSSSSSDCLGVNSTLRM